MKQSPPAVPLESSEQNSATFKQRLARSVKEKSEMAIKFDLNLGTIAAIGVPLLIAGFNVNERLVSVEKGQQQAESFRSARTASTDKNFVDIASLVRALTEQQGRQNIDLSNLTYRMGQIEATSIKNNEAMNARMDRLSETLLGSVKSLSDYVAQLNVKTELINQKIDGLDVPRTKGR